MHAMRAALCVVLVATCARAGVFDACGSEFVPLVWDGLRPDPQDPNGQSYRADYVLEKPLVVGGYVLNRVAVDTLQRNVTVAASESVAYRQESVSWDSATQTDVIGWGGVRVAVTPDSAVNAVGMAPGGELAGDWDSVVYATNPAGGWFVPNPVGFDPLGMVDGAAPGRLNCVPVPGSLPDTACGVAGTLDGDPVTVVLVPELQWVLVSPATYAGLAGDDVAIGVGAEVFHVDLRSRVGGSIHRLSGHTAVADGVVVLGTGGLGAVVELGRTGWVRIASTAEAHAMYADSALDAAVVLVLVVAGVAWTVMPSSRLAPAPHRPGGWTSPRLQMGLAVTVVAVAFAVAVLELVQRRIASRSVLWLECHMAVSGTALGVAVLAVITLAAAALFCATLAAGPTALTPLAMRTAVTIAGTCALLLATLRATGVQYSKRPSLVFATLPVVFMAVMSRSADASVDATPKQSGFASLRSAAAAVALYTLSAAFVLALAVFVVQPTLVVLTVPYVLDAWQQVVLVALAVAKAAWVGWQNAPVLTGVKTE